MQIPQKATSGMTSKGSVAILTSNGRLQLRFNYLGKRHYLSLGLPDTKINRKAAELKAQVIERDIAYGEVDLTLQKYKPQSSLSSLTPSLTPSLGLNELWEKYAAYKQPTLSPSTLNYFANFASHIRKLPTQSLDEAIPIRDYVVSNLTPDAAKRLITNLSAACKWAVKSKLIAINPFEGMASDIKLTHAEADDEYDICPFTKPEQDAILAAFTKNRYYKRYTPFVQFLLWTGARPSEAIALQWRHWNGTTITFEQAAVRYKSGFVVKEGLKTQGHRKFPGNAQIQELLTPLKPESARPTDWIFPSPDGSFINPHNFRVRAWTTVLKEAGVEYRTLYQTRHTFITAYLEKGVSVTQVAKWVGNSPEIIMRHYAGLIATVQVPEL